MPNARKGRGAPGGEIAGGAEAAGIGATVPDSFPVLQTSFGGDSPSGGNGGSAGAGGGPSVGGQSVESSNEVERLAREIADEERRRKQRAYYARRKARERGETVDSSSTPEAAFGITEAPRPTRQYVPRSQARAEDEAKEKVKADSEMQAAMLLLMLDSLAATNYGEDAKLNSIERALIEPALARQIGRLDEKRMAAVQKYADPAAIFAGLMLWLIRMRQLQEQKRESGGNEPPQSRPPDNPMPSPDNGNGQAADISSAGQLHRTVQNYFETVTRP